MCYKHLLSTIFCQVLCRTLWEILKNGEGVIIYYNCLEEIFKVVLTENHPINKRLIWKSTEWQNDGHYGAH